VPTEELLGKLRQLTSRWGVYQHGNLDRPNPDFGYALDDQARALVVAKGFGAKDLEKIYFDFVVNSLDKDGNFYHFFYDKHGVIEADKSIEASQDALGMALWALKESSFENEKSRKIRGLILKKVEEWEFPRSLAYGLLGMEEGELKRKTAEKLKQKFRKEGSWWWFEDELTYGNAIIPWALWRAGEKEVAKEATDFLIEVCQVDGVAAPIGCKGWYKKGGKKAVFDQQPIDAAYMMGCLEQAYLTTGEKKYRDWAKKWWGWFFGENIKSIKLIDESGGCYDAITGEGVNLNQGAESNIAYLMAYLVAKRMEL